ncbi:MAG TPA: hypothetical protein VD861_00420 [Pyrinomonadaceae bacterium]|nr:hypothetical protein [Pyrinomonadaceae bacterium]
MAHATTVHEHADAPADLHTRAPAPRPEVPLHGTADAGRRSGAVENPTQETRTKKREATGNATADARRGAPPQQAEPARPASPQALPEEEARRLLIECELAQGRAAVLRAEEKQFAVMPHRWVAPQEGVTLAQVERQIKEGIGRKENVEGLYAARERVRDEIAAERVALPLRRQEAEDEVVTLERRLRAEAVGRERLGLVMPDADPAPDELRELTLQAVDARDPQRLRRVYEIELAQSLRGAKITDDATPIGRLEEKYAGLEFMAEVRADRSQQSLSSATRDPEKLVLPAKDEAGRDIALTLGEAGPQKGVPGLLKKIIEGRASRLLREQLLKAKAAHLSYLRSDSAGRKEFHEAAKGIARECREIGRQFGLHTPAVPALSREDIAEIRDDARKMTGARRDRLFAVATQAQRLSDEKAASAVPQKRSIEVFLPNRPGSSPTESPQEAIARERARQERLSRAPAVSQVERERPLDPARERNERPPETRPRGSGGRGR